MQEVGNAIKATPPIENAAERLRNLRGSLDTLASLIREVSDILGLPNRELVQAGNSALTAPAPTASAHLHQLDEAINDCQRVYDRAYDEVQRLRGII